MTVNKLKLLFLFLAAGSMLVPSGASSEQPENIRLPSTDFHFKETKDYVESEPDADYRHASAEAFEAFRDIKYGVRIHWGIYSILGQSGESWPFLKMSFKQKQDYQELYKTWNPAGFNADEWMDLFAQNGLKMFAFTAKHHEGFCMFDTQTRVKQRVNWTAPGGPKIEDCDLAYGIMDSPLRRDVVKELCDAAHKRNIKIDLYFSHPDWYDADFRPYGWHPVTVPDFKENPLLYGRTDISQRTKDFMAGPNLTDEQEKRMLARHRQQLIELLSNYGKIDMLCLDNWFGKRNWPQMRQTIKDLRKIQPDVMFRARGIGNYGDYYTPEGFVPGNKENTAMPWFVIYPLGRSFSYEEDAAKYKGGKWIVRNLIDSVAKGGNFMVGIGPDANGKFHPKAIEQLQQAGTWLKVNGEAIYDTRSRPGDDWKEGDNLRFTQKKDGNTIYAISLRWPGLQLAIKTLKPKPETQVLMLGDAKPLKWKNDGGLIIELPLDQPSEASSPLDFAYVFKITDSSAYDKTRE